MGIDINNIELISKFKRGEKEAFDFLYNEFYAVLYTFSFRLVKDREEAKDTAIMALTNLFLKNKDFESVANIRSFLFISARNRAFNYLRHRQVLDSRHKRLMNTSVTTTDSLEARILNYQIDGEFIQKIYNASVNELTDRMREVLDLLFREGLSYADVGEKLNISENTVRNIRVKAVKRVRKHFSENGQFDRIKEMITTVLPLLVALQAAFAVIGY